MTRRLIISGTREELSDEDAAQIVVLLNRYGAEHETIGVGDASGVDALVRRYDPTARVFTADWDRLGKRAGPERNARMVAWCAETGGVLLAFPGPRSRGTWDCVRQARAAGLSVVIKRVGGAQRPARSRPRAAACADPGAGAAGEGVATRGGASMSTHELRYQRDEYGLKALDEVVAHGADLHLERMDADEWLLIARLADGTELRVTLWAEYTIEARAEVEHG